jgi:hypothetical protein
MPDGDEAGQRCAASAMVAVGDSRWTRWIALPPDTQPTEIPAVDLFRLLHMSE